MSRSVTRIHKELVKKMFQLKGTQCTGSGLQKNTKDPKLKKKEFGVSRVQENASYEAVIPRYF